MFLGQFFKRNSNFVVLGMLEAILRAQVYIENNMVMD